MTPVGPGLVDVELVVTGASPFGSNARLSSTVEFADERRFSETGTISGGDVELLRVSTLGTGVLTDAPAPGLRHGTAVLEVEGVGRFAGARGRITSNFVVSDDGEVTDEQVVVLFMTGEEWQ